MKPFLGRVALAAVVLIGVPWMAAAVGELIAGPTPDAATGNGRGGEARPLSVVTSPTPAAGLSTPRPRASVASRSRPSNAAKAISASGTPLNWHALAKCESGNDPQAVNASGKYRGAFQFDLTTWANYGPAGDPAAASYGEQLRRAQALYSDRGRSPWPYCGRFL